MKSRVVLAALCVFASTESLSGPSQGQVIVGDLSTAVVASLLRELDWQKDLVLIGRVETEFKKGGFKVKASGEDLEFKNLFQGLPDDRYSVAFGTGGEAVFRSHMPEASIRATLRLRAKPKKKKFSSEGMFGLVSSMVRMAPGGELFVSGASGVASEMSRISRKYSIDLQGLALTLRMKFGIVEGQVRILDLNLLDVQFENSRVVLLKERDAMGAQLINAFSGEIDWMVKSLIRKQLENSGYVNAMLAPLRHWVTEKISIPASFLAQGATGGVASAESVALLTSPGRMTQLLRINLEGEADPEAPQSFAEDEEVWPELATRPIGKDEVALLLPLDFFLRMGQAMNRSDVFHFNGEKLGFKFQMKPTAVSSLKSESGGVLLWRVPVEISFEGNVLKSMTATAQMKVRPHIDPSKGVHLDLIEASLEDLHTGGSLIPRTLANSFANEVFKSHLARAYPRDALLSSKILLGNQMEVALQEVAVRSGVLRAVGKLQGQVPEQTGLSSGSDIPPPFSLSLHQGKLTCSPLLRRSE